MNFSSYSGDSIIKKKLLHFFHPIIGRQLEFRDFVMQNYSKVNNLDELITLSNIGRTSFFIKFKEEFGITAKQWMMKQLKKRILGKSYRTGYMCQATNGGMQL